MTTVTANVAKVGEVTPPRIWLKEELQARQSRNPHYSLRAFARNLSISPSLLSQILQGKRKLTKKTARKIAVHLCTSPDELNQLLSAVDQMDYGSDLREGEPRLVLNTDVFRMMSDWYHYAISSLGTCEGAKADPVWIADRLGITVETAQAAFDRLKRFGLIVEEGTSYRTIDQNLDTGNYVTSAAHRKFVAQMNDKAQDALISIPFEQRCFRTLTLPLDPDEIEQARDLFDHFLDQFEFKFRTSRKKRVYNFSVQLFPIDKGEEGTCKSDSNELSLEKSVG